MGEAGAIAPWSGARGAEVARRYMSVSATLHDVKRASCAEDAERVLGALAIVSVVCAVIVIFLLRPLLLVPSVSAPTPTPCSETNTPSVTLLTPLSLSHACTALVRATPLTPRARSSAICAHRRSCMSPPRAFLHRAPPPPPLSELPLAAAREAVARVVSLSRVLVLHLRREGGRSARHLDRCQRPSCQARAARGMPAGSRCATQ